MDKGMKHWKAEYQLGNGKRRPLDRYDVHGSGIGVPITLTSYQSSGDGPILTVMMPLESAEVLHAYLGEVLAEAREVRDRKKPSESLAPGRNEG